MAMIEGLGDEVTYALLILFVILVLSLAWLSTGVRPFNYYVWLIQLQTWPQRRVIQVLHMDEQSAAQLERESSSDSQISTRTWRVPTDDSELPTEESSIITHLARFNDLQVEIEEMNPSNPSSSAAAQPAVDGDVSPETTITTIADQTESVTEDGPAANDKCETDLRIVETKIETSAPTQPAPLEQRDQPAQPGDTRIKLKFLDDTQRMVGAWLSQTVGEFKREHFTPAVHEGKVVRLIYRGQLLRDDGRSLASYGLHDNCIVHCHVSTTPYEAANNNSESGNRASMSAPGTIGGSNIGADQSSPPGRLQIGRYINVIFTLKFLALWLGAMLYPELFDFASFFSLFMCTVVYALFVFTNYRARESVAQPRSGSPSATTTPNATAN